MTLAGVFMNQALLTLIQRNLSANLALSGFEKISGRDCRIALQEKMSREDNIIGHYSVFKNAAE